MCVCVSVRKVMRAECKQQQAEKANNEWGSGQHMNSTTRASICDPQQQQQQQQFMTVEGVVLRPCGLSCRPTDQGGPHAAPSLAVTLKKEGITLMSLMI